MLKWYNNVVATRLKYSYGIECDNTSNILLLQVLEETASLGNLVYMSYVD